MEQRVVSNDRFHCSLLSIMSRLCLCGLYFKRKMNHWYPFPYHWLKEQLPLPVDSMVGFEHDVVLCRVYALTDITVDLLELLQTFRYILEVSLADPLFVVILDAYYTCQCRRYLLQVVLQLVLVFVVDCYDLCEDNVFILY